MGFEFELMQFISSFSLVSRTSSILVLFFCWVLIFSAAKRVCLNIINRARLFYLFTIMNYVGVSWFSKKFVCFKYTTMGKVLKFQIRFWLYFIKFSFPHYFLWPVFIWLVFLIALRFIWLCTFLFFSKLFIKALFDVKMVFFMFYNVW